MSWLIFFAGATTGVLLVLGLGFVATVLGWFGLQPDGFVGATREPSTLFTYGSAQALVNKRGLDGAYHISVALCTGGYEPAFDLDMTMSDVPALYQVGRNPLGVFQFVDGVLAAGLSVQIPDIPRARETKHVVLFDAMDGVLLAAAEVDLEDKPLPAIVRWNEGLMRVTLKARQVEEAH